MTTLQTPICAALMLRIVDGLTEFLGGEHPLLAEPIESFEFTSGKLASVTFPACRIVRVKGSNGDMMVTVFGEALGYAFAKQATLSITPIKVQA